MNVFVAGGTGFLGREIVRALVAAGHTVTIGSRSQPSGATADAQVKWQKLNVTDPASIPAAMAGIDVVIDAVQFPYSPIENKKKGYTFEAIDLNGTKNLVDAAKTTGVKQFIVMSGVGAAENGRFHWLRFKWQEEEHIKASGVPFTIIRPSWVYGPGDVSLNRFLGFAKFLPFIPVIGNGKTRVNPLFVNDLAAHAAAAVGKPEAIGQTFEIGGPEVLTMDEIVRTALGSAGKKRFLLHQPAGMMKLVASVLKLLPGPPLTPDAIDFITMDGVADTGSLQKVFGLKLTPLAEGTATYLKK